MRVSFALFAFFCVYQFNSAQIFQWATRNGSLAKDEAYCIAVHSDGSVVSTGTFQGVVDFDPGAGTLNLTTAGSYDIFVQKLDANGALVWARRFGANLADYGQAVASDAWGNVFVSGYFQGTVDFDPGPATANLAAAGSGDVFVVKLDSAGNYLWAKSLGGSTTDISYAIATDEAGSVYSTGYFTGTADFDPGPGSLNFTSNGGYDIYIQKMDSAGNYQWAKRIGSASDDQGWALFSERGFVYVGGEYKGSADFNPNAGTSNLSCLGGSDAFVLKLDTTGSFVWARKFSGADYEKVLGITVDANDNVITTGHFENTADFDPGAATYNLTDNGIIDVFVCKLNAQGNFIWARQAGGSGFDEGYSLDCDGAGNIYVAGYFEDTVDFNPGPGRYEKIAAGMDDVFVWKLDSLGNMVSAKGIGSAGIDYAYSLRLHPITHEMYFGGSFYGPMDADPNSGQTTINSAGSWDVFVCKWYQCVSYGTISPVSCGAYTSSDMQFSWDSSGTYHEYLAGAEGCDSFLTLNLTVIHLDTGVVLNGTTLESSQAGASYQWLDCQNGFTPVNGATGQTYAPAVSGTYAVMLSQGGCSDTSACMPVTVVNAEPDAGNMNLICYPVPAESKVTVSLRSGIPDEIRLYSIEGRLLRSVHPVTAQTEIRLDAIAPGLYLIEVSHAGKNASRLLPVRQ